MAVFYVGTERGGGYGSLSAAVLPMEAEITAFFSKGDDEVKKVNEQALHL